MNKITPNDNPTFQSIFMQLSSKASKYEILSGSMDYNKHAHAGNPKKKKRHKMNFKVHALFKIYTFQDNKLKIDRSFFFWVVTRIFYRLKCFDVTFI